MCSIPDIRPEGYREQLLARVNAADAQLKKNPGYRVNQMGAGVAREHLAKLDRVEQQEKLLGVGGHSAPDGRTQVGTQQGITNMRGAPAAVPNDPAKQKKNLIGQ